jgi:hypothetical protein
MRVHGIQPVRCTSAKVEHLHDRTRSKPTWYYYYAPRNTLYYRNYIAGYTWYRVKRTVYLFPALCYDILRNEKKKVKKLAFVFYGIYHGMTGTIGKTVDPEKNP